MQLHRDSTISSITSQNVVSEGVISVADSPLVLSAREGVTCVVDEADKASLEVVSALKNLSDGEMSLPDGRKLISTKLLQLAGISPLHPPSKFIPIHPNFRLVVLANRPGLQKKFNFNF